MQTQLTVLKDQIITTTLLSENGLYYTEIFEHILINATHNNLLINIAHINLLRNSMIRPYIPYDLLPTHTIRKVLRLIQKNEIMLGKIYDSIVIFDNMETEVQYAKAELQYQNTLQIQRNATAETFNIRATAMITLLTNPINQPLSPLLLNPLTPTTNVTRARIMRAKTDTLRAIRRGQDYANQRETTLDLIETWWTANSNAMPTEGNDTFNNAAQETELFLEMCDVFDADNDTTVTNAFADRVHDFDSVAGVTASLAASRISYATGITNVTNVSRRSRASYVTHPAAAQFFSA